MVNCIRIINLGFDFFFLTVRVPIEKSIWKHAWGAIFYTNGKRALLTRTRYCNDMGGTSWNGRMAADNVNENSGLITGILRRMRKSLWWNSSHRTPPLPPYEIEKLSGNGMRTSVGVPSTTYISPRWGTRKANINWKKIKIRIRERANVDSHALVYPTESCRIQVSGKMKYTL